MLLLMCQIDLIVYAFMQWRPGLLHMPCLLSASSMKLYRYMIAGML